MSAAPQHPQEPTPDDPAPERVATELAAVLGRLSRRMRTVGPAGPLTPSQRSVLARLDESGPATTAALARAEFVRPQSMRQTLGALEERGLVTRTPDPSDGRKSVVSATGEGLAALAGARAVTRGWLAEAIAGELDGRERRTVAEAVALIRRLAEE
ncbi:MULTISPECIES: MarR family winged helix-turn-helix transcriptional regulator [Streptomyces]|uniref:MarR family winged helix-turn-helix transcriptional regulator n=1 Tax=Streptomyces TaxID=1883 RepID=UPI0004BA4DA5|nr:MULTISPECIES: MarR family transcriptional regulator [unclassified Streptomyces]MYY15331.1 MarR family transcriptional regulator [Streptomyces sp. SID4912]WSX36221.1 MarR family transcriptional regulator [Streptomyces halstedii]SCD62486.1 DNA-binding transcriptional regulator, MarR family [Streptomyces sp. DpondAA-D4]